MNMKFDREQIEQKILMTLHKAFSLPVSQIQATIQLLNDANTVPFIARYRKEATGGLDEEQIRSIEERLHYLRNLWQRKEEVLRLIAEQGKLASELEQQILQADRLQEVEDYYRPYKPKRRTKATAAKEKGLEPLADWLLLLTEESPERKATSYLSPKKDLHHEEEALQGAMDIIAERVADEPEMRQWIRKKTWQKGLLTSKVKQKAADEKHVYEMYYDYTEAVSQIVPHRVLAINRGEKEDILQVSIEAPVEEIEGYLIRRWLNNPASPSAQYVEKAIIDGYKRLIAPAVQREIRRELTERAEEQAIQIFAKNLRALLLQPPVRGKMVLGIDPAYRTGCKLAVVDPIGKMLHVGVIFPTPPHNKVAEAKTMIHQLIDQFNIEIIAIGNGTASRETEQFVAEVIQERDEDLAYVIINEAGASVYSASPLAKKEFPELDVAERSAVSIARRLQDPLAELVKIDPKSIGIGQYQHDVSQNRLNESLTFVVETVVNQVGVDVNTASVSLLQYVSGLNKSVAAQIVKKREEEGPFSSRTQLKQVPRLGRKTYEQAIGFLRVFNGEHPFDETPIHPETYAEAEKFLTEFGFKKEQIGSRTLNDALEHVQLQEWSDRLEIGLPTLQDIIDALRKPRRDPRDELAQPLLMKNIMRIEDLSEGMALEGTIRNVVDFGAFVDIGLKNDGLIHISQLSKSFVNHPLDVVSVGDIVKVWVKNVDLDRERVGLTMIDPQE